MQKMSRPTTTHQAKYFSVNLKFQIVELCLTWRNPRDKRRDFLERSKTVSTKLDKQRTAGTAHATGDPARARWTRLGWTVRTPHTEGDLQPNGAR